MRIPKPGVSNVKCCRSHSRFRGCKGHIDRAIRAGLKGTAAIVCLRKVASISPANGNVGYAQGDQAGVGNRNGLGRAHFSPKLA